MYKFIDVNSDLLGNCKDIDFIQVLKAKWNRIHDYSDVFRYKIYLQERVVDSTYLLQLNPNRNTKRRTPEQIENICQPIDENKFNFSKVSQKEILFHIFEDNDESDKHTLLVNVSPISRYHTLLCPSLSKLLPQVVTEDSIKLILDVMDFAQDRDLRIGFNSLCALASVNHLHYHLLLEPHDLPVESVKCKQLRGPVYRFDDDYPCPAFCYQYDKDSSSKTTASDIFKLLSFFINNTIAHNIMVTRGKNMKVHDATEVVRVLIWPRNNLAGAKQLAEFNIAVLELSGWFPIFNSKCFENIGRSGLEEELQKSRIADFNALCEQVKSLY